MSLELLPQELLHLVTCHLSAKQYLRLYSTCKQLYGMRTPYNFKVTKLKRFLEKAPIPVLENYSFVGTKSDWVLMVACRRGAFQLVDRLLTSQEAQRTDYALPKQWTDEADELISITMGMKDYKPKSEHHTKVTLLHIAAIFDQQEICQLLLDRGADVDANCQKSCTPLLISLIKRNAQLSLFLLERGADPNGNGMDGRHILTEASSCGTPEILTKLIEGGAQLPEDDIPVFFSAAATNGSLEVVKWIFEQEQYRHMIGENALSIVHNAVSSPTPKMEYILAKLHEIVQHPYLKEEAMLYADEEESMHNVEWLLDQGALIDGPPDSRESLLANAARDGEVDLMEFLLDRGASMHIGNDQKDNPFLLAIMDNQLEACELLVERNPDIVKWSCRDGQQGALHFACTEPDLEMFQFLVEHGAPVDGMDETGCTPLIYVAELGNEEVCEFLIEEGADVNKTDNFGRSPLIACAHFQHEELAQLLLEHGAKIPEAIEPIVVYHNMDVNGVLEWLRSL